MCIRDRAYTFLNYGYAITLSVLTFVCVFVLTIIQMSIGREKTPKSAKKQQAKRIHKKDADLQRTVEYAGIAEKEE